MTQGPTHLPQPVKVLFIEGTDGAEARSSNGCLGSSPGWCPQPQS
jgi:hypothetical protein